MAAEKRVVFRSAWLPWVLIAPQVVIIAVFFFWPAGQALLQSLQQSDAFGTSVEWVGLENFRNLFNDESYLASFKTTAVFSVLVAVFGSTLTTVTIAIGVVSWPAPARLTRAEFLSLRNREFVQAAQTLGLKDAKLIFGEILPNALPSVIVYASVVMAVAILLESALAFLKLSDPNVASWGNLIGLGRDVLRVQWYVSAIPGIAILVTVLGVSLVGQGLNDALNPRLKGR